MPHQPIRFIFFSDTHLGFDYPLRPRVERRRRGEDFFANFHRVLNYAINQRVDFVIHGGDLFFRSKVPKPIIDRVYQALLDFAENDIPLFIVPGNHERSNLPTSLLLGHPKIFIFDQSRTFTVQCGHAICAISGFPFERDNIKARFRTVLQKTRWQHTAADVRLLVLHQAMEGAQVGPKNFTFRHGRDVIAMQDIPVDFLAVLAGHIHRQQILTNHKPNSPPRPVIFCGSTERTSFAEKEEQKGFYEITFAQPSNEQWCIQSIKFIPLPTRPMVDLVVQKNLAANSLKPYLMAEVQKLNTDAIVRIKCNGQVSPEVARMLTSQFLREVFPKTMNVQLGMEFREMLFDVNHEKVTL